MATIHVNATGSSTGRLVACPACKADFTDDDGRPKPGNEVSRHIATHDPQDFGLTPLGVSKNE